MLLKCTNAKVLKVLGQIFLVLEHTEVNQGLENISVGIRIPKIGVAFL